MSKLTLILGIVLGIVAVVLVNWHIAQIEGDSKAAPFLTLSVALRDHATITPKMTRHWYAK